MKTKLLHESDGQRTFAAIFEVGDEAMAGIRELADREKITAAQITGLGAFSDAVLCYFDWQKKEYLENRVDEQVEVASLVGDIGIGPDGKPALHVHLVLGRRDGSAIAGHLASAHVRPTLELIVTESPAYLRRKKDSETGLNLISV